MTKYETIYHADYIRVGRRIIGTLSTGQPEWGYKIVTPRGTRYFTNKDGMNGRRAQRFWQQHTPPLYWREGIIWRNFGED